MGAAAFGCRLKATLERAQRLTQGYTDSLLGVLPAMANRIGAALGIEAERQQVLIASQVSKTIMKSCCWLGSET